MGCEISIDGINESCDNGNRNICAPIIGATKMSHLDDAVASLDVNLSEEELHYLEEPYRTHPVLCHS